MHRLLVLDKNRQEIHRQSEFTRQRVGNSLRITRDVAKRFCARVMTTCLDSVTVGFCEVHHIFDMTITMVDVRTRIKINKRIKATMDNERALQKAAELQVAEEVEEKRKRDETERIRQQRLQQDFQMKEAIKKKVAAESAKNDLLFVAKVRRDELIAEINTLRAALSEEDLKRKVAMFGRMRLAARKL